MRMKPPFYNTLSYSVAHFKKKKLPVQKHRQSCGSRCGKKKQRLQTLWLDYIKVLYHTYKEKGKEPP